jgi:hypothetical protein
METMKVMRFNDSPEAPALIFGTAPIPESKEGELLIKVHAAGVTQPSCNGTQQPINSRVNPELVPFPDMNSPELSLRSVRVSIPARLGALSLE